MAGTALAERASNLSGGLRADLRTIRNKVSRVSQGREPFVDIPTKKAMRLATLLDELDREFIGAFIPSKD